MTTHRVRLDVHNGPWNDDKALGPYYKINCQDLHEFEEFMAQKLDEAERNFREISREWTDRAMDLVKADEIIKSSGEPVACMYKDQAGRNALAWSQNDALTYGQDGSMTPLYSHSTILDADDLSRLRGEGRGS